MGYSTWGPAGIKVFMLLSLEDAQKAGFIPGGCGRGQMNGAGASCGPICPSSTITLHLPASSEPPCPLL